MFPTRFLFSMNRCVHYVHVLHVVVVFHVRERVLTYFTFLFMLETASFRVTLILTCNDLCVKMQ